MVHESSFAAQVVLDFTVVDLTAASLSARTNTFAGPLVIFVGVADGLPPDGCAIATDPRHIIITRDFMIATSYSERWPSISTMLMCAAPVIR